MAAKKKAKSKPAKKRKTKPASNGKHPGGRPPLFDDPDKMQASIDEYFDNPPKETFHINGAAIDIPVVTITGLALHLGFESRQSFYDYELKPEFTYAIKRARMQVENKYEIKLLTGGQAAGPIFALKNLGWSDKQEIDHSSKDGSMTPKQAVELTDDQLARIALGNKG